MSITPNELSRLSQIFTQKNWNKAEQVSGRGQTIFDAFCSLLSELDEIERALLLSLTEDFEWCTFDKYPGLLRNTFLQFDPLLLQPATDVYFAPLVDSILGKARSAGTLVYPAAYGIVPHIASFNGKTIRALSSLSDLDDFIDPQKQNLLIMVDDFVGTGESAAEPMDNFEANFADRNCSLAIVSLIAMEQGLSAIQLRGHYALSGLTFRRAISDSGKFPNVGATLATMDSIELKLEISAFHKYGFGSSEALVATMRTPDNTFPVYWCEKSANSTKWPAPFPRGE